MRSSKTVTVFRCGGPGRLESDLKTPKGGNALYVRWSPPFVARRTRYGPPSPAVLHTDAKNRPLKSASARKPPTQKWATVSREASAGDSADAGIEAGLPRPTSWPSGPSEGSDGWRRCVWRMWGGLRSKGGGKRKGPGPFHRRGEVGRGPNGLCPAQAGWLAASASPRPPCGAAIPPSLNDIW